jgi:hypothetical protein
VVLTDPPPSRWWLSAALGGHASFDGALTSSGRLVLDVGEVFGFGALLDGGLETNRSQAVGPGVIQASIVYASLLARYRVAHAGFAGVFGLGARLFHISASGIGYVDPTPQQIWSPAAAASAEVQWSPLGGFFLCATVQAFARFHEENLVIEGLDAMAHIEQFGVTAGLGMGVRLN